jgi:hypothetical protein
MQLRRVLPVDQNGALPDPCRIKICCGEIAQHHEIVNSAAQLHGWNQHAGVNVNIANIPMPTAEERAEMRALDRKLDAIAAKLRGSAGN